MDTMKKAWLNAVLLIVTLAINTLGALGLINGLTQKQISDMYVTLITPSSATFGIWSIIYLLLLISVIVMIARRHDPYYQKAVDQISVLFWISCGLNAVWIVSFSFVLVEISSLFILGFVVVLALIGGKLLAINEGRRWLLPLSFGLYAGWLFIATVVNVAAALIKLGWDGFGLSQETWGVIMLIVAIALLSVVLLKIRNAVFPLPVAWAYFGIYQYLKSPSGFNGAYATLQIASLCGSAVLLALTAVLFIRYRFALLPFALLPASPGKNQVSRV